jgi:chemotaxis protein CheD
MIITDPKPVHLGLGELAVTRDTKKVLICIGLGSCIALCIYDPVEKISGMAHLLLPCDKYAWDTGHAPAKYVTSGVPLLIGLMLQKGSLKENLIIKIAGGAKVLTVPGDNSFLDIGLKNIVEVHSTLNRQGLKICQKEVGGNSGRTVWFFTDTGKIIVHIVNGKSIEI